MMLALGWITIPVIFIVWCIYEIAVQIDGEAPVIEDEKEFYKYHMKICFAENERERRAIRKEYQKKYEKH